MSSLYVFNAIGFYPYSPADPEYIVTVPIFERVTIDLPLGEPFTIARKHAGMRITRVTVGGRKLEGFFLAHRDVAAGHDVIIYTDEP
jgi:putative alpha-1,2-mannosidase